MPRPDIRMSPAEVETFLATKRRAVIGTIDPTGAPDGDPAEFTWSAGEATFTVDRSGHAHHNLLRDARVVCSLEEFPSYKEIRGVTLHGRAKLTAETGEQAVFRITDMRVESFDFRKMR